jgi:hypothetical protein
MASKQTKAKPTHLEISYSIHLMRVWLVAGNSSVADISVPIEDISVAGAISKTRVSSATQALLTLIPWQVLLCKGIATSIGVSCASKHLFLYMDLS